MTEVEVLKEVIDRLKDPTHWVKGIRALTPQGWDTPPTHPSAAAWCLGGAVINVLQNELWAGWYGADPIGRRFHELANARGFTGRHGFVEFNNDPATTHEDLMMFLKEALYDAEIEEHQTGPVQVPDTDIRSEWLPTSYPPYSPYASPRYYASPLRYGPDGWKP